MMDIPARDQSGCAQPRDPARGARSVSRGARVPPPHRERPLTRRLPGRLRAPPSDVDPDAKLSELERNEIDGAVVSTAPPLCYYQLVGDSAATIARTVNAGVEGFPNTPRTGSGGCDHADEDPDLAVEILEEASGRPSCVGVEVGSSIGGVRLDVSRFEPCLPRRRARAPARTARLWARATRGLIPLNTCVGGSLSPLQEAIALQATAGWP
jgi:hypothetical protein